MKIQKLAMVAAAFAAIATAPTVSSAAVIGISNPGGSGVIGARIRWGLTGWEAAIRSTVYCSTSAPNLCPAMTLDPPGAPVWQVNTPYAFKVEYKTDGTLYLGVDFDVSGGFGPGESLTYNFAALNGLAFDYLQIFGNDGTSAESRVSDLTINGTSIGTLASGAGPTTNTFYDDNSAGRTAWLVTGNLTFLTLGTNDQAPSWDFNFRSPGPVPVSAPGTLALAGLALLSVGALRRRRA